MITAKQINEISMRWYGHDVVTIDPLAALWLAEKITKDDITFQGWKV